MNEWEEKLRAAAKRYIEADARVRSNPINWFACGPDLTTKEGWLYHCQRNELESALSKLWMLTDVNYDEDPIKKACWEWRYCRVMSKKCCHIQLKNPVTGSKVAAQLMKNLKDAETQLFDVLDLSFNNKSRSRKISMPKVKIESEVLFDKSNHGLETAGWTYLGSDYWRDPITTEKFLTHVARLVHRTRSKPRKTRKIPTSKNYHHSGKKK